jgi:hypothetical protein
MQRIAPGLILLCGLICLTCAACPKASDSGASASAGLKPQPGTEAVPSPALNWRTLPADSPGDATPSVPVVEVIPGHFIQGSPDQQALQLGKTGSRLFSADLTVTAAALKTSDPVPDEVAAWDYNRDGVDDLAFSPLLSIAMEQDIGKDDAPSGSAVFALDGKLLGIVPSDMSSTTAIGDFDGDGHRDLALLPLITLQPVNAPAYGGNGERIGYFKIASQAVGALAADVDGDGKDELVRLQANPHSLVYYALGSPLHVLGAWGAADTPRRSARLSGVKSADLVSSSCIWNANLKQSVDLAAGSGGKGGGLVPPPVAFAQLPDGRTVIATTPAGADPGQRNRLLLYDANGRQVQSTTLPADILGLTSLESGGRTYLIARLQHQLLIYP